MKSKIHIVMRNDLVILPPMQSLITVLLEKGVQVHFLGKCSDIERKSYFARLGVVFEDVIYTPQDKIYKTLLEQIRYRRLLKQYLSVNMNNDTDIIWFEYSDMAYIVYDIFKNYDYLIHFYEFQNLHSIQYGQASNVSSPTNDDLQKQTQPYTHSLCAQK